MLTGTVDVNLAHYTKFYTQMFAKGMDIRIRIWLLVAKLVAGKGKNLQATVAKLGVQVVQFIVMLRSAI